MYIIKIKQVDQMKNDGMNPTILYGPSMAQLFCGKYSHPSATPDMNIFLLAMTLSFQVRTLKDHDDRAEAIGGMRAERPTGANKEKHH